MHRNHPGKVQQQNNLLGWFIIFSVLAHGIFLVIPDDAEEKKLYVNLSSPLLVTVMSSRSASQPVQITETDTTLMASQQSENSKTLPVNRVKKSAISHRKHISPEPDKRHVTSADTARPATDNNHSASLSESPVKPEAAVDTQKVPLNNLRQQLKEMIKARFTYPRMARRMGWEGQVGLSLHIEDDGSLNQVRVARSSGHKVLDDNAKKTIQGIGRIQIASSLSIQAADTEIEVLYRLTD